MYCRAHSPGVKTLSGRAGNRQVRLQARRDPLPNRVFVKFRSVIPSVAGRHSASKVLFLRRQGPSAWVHADTLPQTLLPS
ncbi:hypothetical protein CFB45_33630 [Burkholderia sp. HI2500]|nr:hypothetical protein CFB45_33630 [Burkholderia sp. HI2500]